MRWMHFWQNHVMWILHSLGVECNYNMMAHGNVTEGNRRGKRRMGCVVSKVHKNVVEASVAVAYTLQVSTHTLAANTRLNSNPPPPPPPYKTHGLGHLAKRWKLVSADVPSHNACTLLQYNIFKRDFMILQMEWLKGIRTDHLEGCPTVPQQHIQTQSEAASPYMCSFPALRTKDMK
jgi:hypothetical protein